ncbi:MAG TPA: diacylglycerol kinase family protein, partial [Actinomycetes bacterium]|nr:diacylglycerol kinase family protein [Actinomycetes bacterium]
MPSACVAHVGSAAWEQLPEALHRLRPRFGRIPVYPAGEPGDAETLAAELAGEVDVLLVFGGDGTVHEVANGLPLGGGDPLVALLPAGTGNDLARALGLPPDPVAAASELATARPRTLDLLDCGPRRAANGINAGFAAAATDTLSRPVKKALGPAAYVVGGVKAGVNPPTWPARVEVDGRVVEGEALAVVVGNGRIALDALEKEPFDLIVMDVQMPEMSGLEATVAIRQREKGTSGHIPIIAMTAHAMEGDREKCLTAGMDQYVTKPIDQKRLFEVIEGFCAAQPASESPVMNEANQELCFSPDAA